MKSRTVDYCETGRTFISTLKRLDEFVHFSQKIVSIIISFMVCKIKCDPKGVLVLFSLQEHKLDPRSPNMHKHT